MFNIFYMGGDKMKLSKLLKKIGDDTFVGLYIDGISVYTGQKDIITGRYRNLKVKSIYAGRVITVSGKHKEKVCIDLIDNL